MNVYGYNFQKNILHNIELKFKKILFFKKLKNLYKTIKLY